VLLKIAADRGADEVSSIPQSVIWRLYNYSCI